MYNHIGIKSHTRQQAVRCSMLQDDGTVPLQWLSQPPLEWSRTPGSSQDSPSPCMGSVGRHRSPASNRQERQCVNQEKAWEVQSHWRGSPRRCQHLLPANRGLPSQLPARSCDKTCSVLHPDLLPSHNAHLGASPCRSSSSLGTLCLHHHCPPSFTSPTKAADTPTLQHHHKPLVKGEKGASLLPVEVRASFSI